MDSNSIDAIRKADVSRRGGVRVRGGRLPPIRIRNATNTGQNKKTIAPNIPQRRSKTDVSSSEKPEQKHRTKDVHEEFGFKSRGRGRGARVYIQTEGTFLGEGPALKTQKDPVKPIYERSSTSKSSGPRSKQDQKIDSEMINTLLDCYDEQEAYENYPDAIAPLRLPMLKVKPKAYKTEEVKQEEEEEEDTKSTIRIKEEPLDDDEISKISIDKKLLTAIKTENTNIKLEDTKPMFCSDGKIFQDNNQMLLLQLPSYLPFPDMKKSSVMEHGKEKSSVKTKTMDDNPKDQVSGANVKDVSEGYIGKLQVMRSGRVRLVVGSVIFELEQGLEPEIVREVASVSVGENGDGSMIVLGRIGRKLILRPDFSQKLDGEY